MKPFPEAGTGPTVLNASSKVDGRRHKTPPHPTAKHDKLENQLTLIKLGAEIGARRCGLRCIWPSVKTRLSPRNEEPPSR